MRLVKAIIASAGLAIFSIALPAAAEDMQNREYPITAAYIYNFTQFTTWPSLSNSLGICVLGRNPFGELLNPLRGKFVQGAKISVRYYKEMESSVSSCAVLFISNSESDAPSILAALKDTPVLTMSNISGFADSGGMVEFVKKDTRIGMRINLKAVKQAGFSISSKLLNLAQVVE